MYLLQQKKWKIAKNRQILVKIQKKHSANAIIIVFFYYLCNELLILLACEGR